MKKFTAFALSLLTIVPFVAIAWLLYSNFHSTPVVIINLLIVMTGVMLAFIVFNRIIVGNDKNAIVIDTDHFPYIERALIYVMPQDFVAKLEKSQGTIFLATNSEVGKKVSIIEGDFNKLTDTISLKFTNGISTTIRGSRTVAVGDNQFLFHGFDELIHKEGKEETVYIWEDDRLVLRNGAGFMHINIPDRLPVFIFDWK
ncbi:hypothetical protein [Brumimicrobium mesophilum]|uniref:hypothetical protein n=1 Tax=Brumimicrobium mesophilum TaxID=392717 RepID=UPI000D141185|nr:hypothetical protein [Brumimicrobium mesophilum]